MGDGFNYSVKENTNNVFEFINYKLAFGGGEPEFYLSKQGEYIVDGYPFRFDWKEWAYNHGLDSEFGVEDFENCSEDIIEDIKFEYEESKEEWLRLSGIEENDFGTLELLHKQYKAIEEYSKNPNNEEAKQIILGTFALTGINCLRYLVDLKTAEEWRNLTDGQGSQICAVFTGYDPCRFSDDEQRKSILSYMHRAFCFYLDLIDQLTAEKEIQSENQIK